MWRIPLAMVLVAATSFVVSSHSSAEAQRRVYGGRLNIQDLVRRIEQLERRVTLLERRQPRPEQRELVLDVDEAERRAAAATERQSFSARQFSKGYISEAEFEADEFEMARAIEVLKLAQATRDGRPTEAVAHRIEMLEAQHDLAVTKRQLRFAEDLLRNGFADTDLAGYRQAVDEAQARLDAVTSP